MLREANIIRTVDRISAYIQRCVTVIAAERREEVVELFDSMNLLFPHWGIMSCPAMHPEIQYISKNMGSILGHTQEYISLNRTVDKTIRFVHEDDKDDVHQCMVYMQEFLETVPPDEHQNYRCVLHYRFQKADGQYIYLHDEKATLNLRGEGNLYYCLFHNQDNEQLFAGVKLEIFHQQNTLYKLREHRPAATRNPLSKRERELVTLIKRGLSTKEIAWHLNISHNTVRNIKSKLFEKYNVNNSIELLNMAG